MQEKLMACVASESVVAMEPAKLNALLQLSHCSVGYVLLSGFYGDSGGDIDLYIPALYRKEFQHFCEAYGVLEQKRATQFENHFFYFLHADGLRPVRIHVKYDLSFWDKRIGKFRRADFEDSVLQNSRTVNQWRIPGAWHLILLYAAKCAYVEKTALDARQIDHLRAYLAANRGQLTSDEHVGVANELSRVTDLSQPLLEYSDDVGRVIERYVPVSDRRPAKKKQTVWDRVGFPAYSLLLVGPDGSGKSTLLQSVQSLVELPTARLYGGLGKGEWMLPFVDNFRKWAERKGRHVRAVLLGVWMFALFPIEMLLRVARRVCFARNALLLIDRFPEFAFVGHVAKYLSKLYGLLLPQPDLVIEVVAPVNVLVARRVGELDEATAARKSLEAHDLARYFHEHGSAYVRIDTSNISATDASADIIEKLWSDERFVRRMLMQPRLP
jgi:energy-coupling factor transporter ATP-binding protein EcfA2